MRSFIFLTIFLISSCRQHTKQEKIILSTNVIVENTHETFLFDSCEAKKSNDTLFLKLVNSSNSRNDYEIEILMANNQYFSFCNLTYAALDCTWRSPVFKNVNQDIHLDKEKYNTQDILKGQVALMFYSKQTMFDKTTLDTIKVNGSIEAIVQ